MVLGKHNVRARVLADRELVQRRLGIRHRGDHILRDDRIEAPVRELQVLGIHHGELLDMCQAERRDAPPRLGQHRLGNVDSNHADPPPVVRKRDPRSDPDLKDPPADPLGRLYGGRAPGGEDRAKHEIINRSPAIIGSGDAFSGQGHGRTVLDHAAVRMADGGIRA